MIAVRSSASASEHRLELVVREGHGYRRATGRLLLSYMNYYNVTRAHLSLAKDAPLSRTVKRQGILCGPVLGGLHHQYGGFDLRQAQVRDSSGQ